MDEDTTIKKSTHFTQSGKYVENFKTFTSAYNILPFPFKVQSGVLNLGQNNSSSDDGTITPVDTPKL